MMITRKCLSFWPSDLNLSCKETVSYDAHHCVLIIDWKITFCQYEID